MSSEEHEETPVLSVLEVNEHEQAGIKQSPNVFACLNGMYKRDGPIRVLCNKDGQLLEFNTPEPLLDDFSSHWEKCVAESTPKEKEPEKKDGKRKVKMKKHGDNYRASYFPG
jgi:hypothetical protein